MPHQPLAPELPAWALASPGRRKHMLRVGALMADWAAALGLGQSEVARWHRTGWLHDCLRDAPPEQLRGEVPAHFRNLPAAVLHGPAAAKRLADSIDAEMADAIRFHTLGYAGWDRLGCALYLADYLEPARKWDPEGRAALRARVPSEFGAVLREVVAQRLMRLISQGQPVRPESVAFWNRLAGER
ncbi:hypothetical protein BH23GEM5_BH23GEM5_01640 [soil metagenome]